MGFRKEKQKSILRIPISIKMVAATLLLLSGSIGPLVYVATLSFEGVSQDREIDANQTFVRMKSFEMDNILQNWLEKAKTLGLMSLRNERQEAINLVLEQDRDIFAVDVYERESGNFSLRYSLLKAEKLIQFGADESLIEKIRTRHMFSFDLIGQGQIEVRRVSGTFELPVIGLGFPLTRDDVGRTNSIAIAFLSAATLQKIFFKQGNREIFLIDSKGHLLSHPDEKLLLQDPEFNNHPLAQAAENSREPSGIARFTDNESKAPLQGAFARTVLGPLVLAQLPESDILQPSRLVRQKSMVITGIVMSISFLFVFLLSLSLVNPIEKLAALIRLVSHGDLDISARQQIKSHDEVGDLALAFDEMVGGLRERAKAYAVMNQAMGSSVVETLMNMKAEELGGQKKPVTVLFSDLRDFTKFSEGHSPEEVVVMLNEYFDVMVRVINRHGGWLDKFIGDAIMAVWGVPYTADGDAQRAVQAALDMRIALAQLNEKRLERNQAPIRIGVGLHCGEAIVGKIGATERANLTVIGDTVNQSSRIEASTKAFGVDILISEELENEVRDCFAMTLAGQAEVKGKSEPLKFFKLVGIKHTNGEIEIVKTPYSEFQAEAVDKIKVS